MKSLRSRRSPISVGAFSYREEIGYSVALETQSVWRARQILPRRLVLLVHGWNVRTGGESGSYDQLLKRIEQNDGALADAILTVAWPSHGLYADIANTVAEAAGALAREIADPQSRLSATEEITIIGHSMGCRFALELGLELKSLFMTVDLPAIRFFLMAAAVPVSAMGKEGHLRSAIDERDMSVVYYSPADMALGSFFKVFERGVGRNEGEEAVGSHGKPVEGVWARRVHMRAFNHWHYWRSSRIAGDIVQDLRRRTHRRFPERA